MENLEDIHVLKAYLKRTGLRIRGERGQNFLVSGQALRTIIDAAELSEKDAVIEIGAGLGTLTAKLASRCAKVLAYEIDGRFASSLMKLSLEYRNIEILQEDFLRANVPGALSSRGILSYKIVANIPYYITGGIIRTILGLSVKPDLIILLMQKEVAERIVASPGELSVLALSVQYYGRPEIVAQVPSSDFFPPPEVDSAILKIALYNRPALDIPEKDFFRLVRIGFSSRRKTLLNNLSSGLRLPKTEVQAILSRSGISDSARAQELPLIAWQRLNKELDPRRPKADRQAAFRSMRF